MKTTTFLKLVNIKKISFKNRLLNILSHTYFLLIKNYKAEEESKKRCKISLHN